MAIKINSNIAAQGALRQLNMATDALGSVYERLSSGLRINKASDDPAGLAVATSLSASGRIYSQGMRNLNDGISATNVAGGAGEQLTQILTRMKELATAAANGAYSATQRQALHTESQALQQEFNRIIKTTKFNGTTLLTGMDVQLQAGGNQPAGQRLAITLDPFAFGGDGTFRASTSYTAGLNQALVLADVNRDGAQDVITASSQDDKIYVLTGNGDGTLRAPVSYAAGDGAYWHVANDFNGDGYVDVATASNVDGKVNILFGNSNGTFKAPVTYTSGPSLVWLSTADVNGDGNQDLLTLSYNPNARVNVHLGNGNGTFTAPVTYATTGSNSGPRSLVIADFNNDGVNDVAVSSSLDDAVAILLGNSNGTFKAATSFRAGDTAYSLDLIDVNHDGNLDILCTGYLDDSVNVLLSNGNGSFKVNISYYAGDGPAFITHADLNSDGYQDVISSAFDSGTLQILYGNVDGSFTAGTSFVGAASNWPTAVGDLNSDGVSDLITGVYNGGIAVLMGNGDARLPGVCLLSVAEARVALTTIDSALTKVQKEVGRLGSHQSRFEIAFSNLQSIRDNYSMAEHRIVDADVAQDSAELVRLQIFQEAATAIMAQANQQPQIALMLLAA